MREAGERHPDEVASIEELSDDILFCKSRFFHQMVIVGLEENTWGDKVNYRCEICGREREDDVDPNGAVLYRHYPPLQGARVAGEKLQSGDIRCELLRRYKLGEIRVASGKTRLRSVRKPA